MKKVLFFSWMALFLASCSQVAVTGRKQLLLVSDQEVLSASLQQYNDYMKGARLSTDPDRSALVRRIGERMTQSVEHYLKAQGLESELKNFAWEFHLVQDSVPNAFCMPGGKIVVNEGILPYTQNEPGLAVVVGHEIAHAVAKHGNERLSQQLVAQAGAGVLNLALEKKSALTRTAAQAAFGLGAQVGVLLPYSRQHEYEADYIGLVLMQQANYDIDEATAFWKRMSAKGGSASDFLSTHPADDKRIAELERRIAEIKAAQ